MSQLVKIQKCFAKAYCQIKQMQCLGKETANQELLLKKLYLAEWSQCGVVRCSIDCFLNQNCNNC